MATKTTLTQYAKKLNQLEGELLKLKKGAGFGVSKTPISLKGFLKGVEVSAGEFKQAKKSLFKKGR